MGEQSRSHVPRPGVRRADRPRRGGRLPRPVECESLGCSEAQFRTSAAGVAMAGKSQLSSEMLPGGFGNLYGLTPAQIAALANRESAFGANQMVFHGLPYPTIPPSADGTIVDSPAAWPGFHAFTRSSARRSGRGRPRGRWSPTSRLLRPDAAGAAGRGAAPGRRGAQPEPRGRGPDPGRYAAAERGDELRLRHPGIASRPRVLAVGLPPPVRPSRAWLSGMSPSTSPRRARSVGSPATGSPSWSSATVRSGPAVTPPRRGTEYSGRDRRADLRRDRRGPERPSCHRGGRRRGGAPRGRRPP